MVRWNSTRHFGHFLLETLARVQSREVVRSAEPIYFSTPLAFPGSNVHEGVFIISEYLSIEFRL